MSINERDCGPRSRNIDIPDLQFVQRLSHKGCTTHARTLSVGHDICHAFVDAIRLLYPV